MFLPESMGLDFRTEPRRFVSMTAAGSSMFPQYGALLVMAGGTTDDAS
jgi:hypothetical protein